MSKKMLYLLITIVFMIIGCSSGVSERQIQKELNNNPFLKEEKISLKVIEFKEGYLTLEMDEGNRQLRKDINEGLDIFSEDLSSKKIFVGVSEAEKKAVIALKKSLEYIKSLEGVKAISLKAAINTDRDKAWDLLAEAKKHRNKKRLAECIKKADQAISVSPNLEYSYYWKATCLTDIGEQIANYKKAIDINPSEDNSHNRLAWIYATSKDKKYLNSRKALSHAKKAYELEPLSWTYIDTLAAAYARNGDYEKAIEYQEKSISILKNKTYEVKKKYLKRFKSKVNTYKNNKPYTEIK